MPDARAFTGNMETLRAILDSALEAPEGVTLYFRSPPHTPAAAAAAARGIQTSFSSLRARVRRSAMRRAGELHARDVNARGAYDTLMCQREALDGGSWAVRFVRAGEFLQGIEIIDNATGKPLTSLGQAQDERERLIDKAIMGIGGKLTAADWDRLTELDARAFPTEAPWHSPNGVMTFPRPTDSDTPPLEGADAALPELGKLFDAS